MSHVAGGPTCICTHGLFTHGTCVFTHGKLACNASRQSAASAASGESGASATSNRCTHASVYQSDLLPTLLARPEDERHSICVGAGCRPNIHHLVHHAGKRQLSFRPKKSIVDSEFLYPAYLFVFRSDVWCSLCHHPVYVMVFFVSPPCVCEYLCSEDLRGCMFRLNKYSIPRGVLEMVWPRRTLI